MFPWVYEFHWSAGQIIFLGLFFTVVILVGTTVAISLLRSRRRLHSGTLHSLQWEMDFEDLPGAARVCRHELSGEVRHRTCDHEFDCRTCTVHPKFLALCRSSPGTFGQAPDPAGNDVFGFTMPADRMYHRGHTWVQPGEGGVYTIGLDDFAHRLVGTPESVELPAPGTRLETNGTGWILTKADAKLRVLSPIDGEVIAQGGPEKGWYLRVKGDGGEKSTRHLLRGGEIRPWIMREMERLQLSLSADSIGMALADGGQLVPDIYKLYPEVDWDGVWGEMLLKS